MGVPRYTASKSQSTGRTSWSVMFRHPLQLDSRGKPGRKVRRGLGTDDDAKADLLVAQLNALLADESYWTVAARSRAEKRFDPVIVDAFYSGVEVPLSDPMTLREEAIPLPGKNAGYATVLFVGTTGAGKTTLLRHLIGSDPRTDRFPSTATGRTTTADTEVVTSEGRYEAVVTFLSQAAVRSYLQECLDSAVLAAWNGSDAASVARRLLYHPDQTFRLSYTLGTWEVEDDDEAGWGFEPAVGQPLVPDEGEALSDAEREQNARRLEAFVSRIAELSRRAGKELETNLGVARKDIREDDLEAAESMLLEQAEAEDEYETLMSDILDAILERFGFVREGRLSRATTGWPTKWEYADDDRERFLKQVRWFSSNHAPRFGRLLTPLVQGIRVRGPFFPAFTDRALKLVLLDGQGLGHTADSASSVSTHVTGRFSSVDVILLVDSAQQPMQAASLAALRAVAVGGHQRKLLLAFTHFDQVKGPNLPTSRAKRDHVLAAARTAVVALRTELGDGLVRAIAHDLQTRCFTFGWMDDRTDELPQRIVLQLKEMLDAIQASIKPVAAVAVHPVYDPAGLMFAIQNATRDFHARWDALLGLASLDGVRKEHWSRVKALNRRIANGWEVEYDSLQPVAELYSHLQGEISRFLEQPVRFDPVASEDEARTRAVDGVRTSVSTALHGFVLTRLIQNHLADWGAAYGHVGRGSTFMRAQGIRDIYEEAAPVPGVVVNERMKQFLDSVRTLVHGAIEDGGGVLSQVVPRPDQRAAAGP